MTTPTLPDDLLAVICATIDPDQLSQLLTDLLTPSEIEAIGERWTIVKRLASGESQRAVRDALGCSVTTVSRGSRQLQYGTGGFAKAFDTLAAIGLPDPRRS